MIHYSTPFMRKYFSLLFALCVFVSNLLAQNAGKAHLLATFKISGDGSWDYLALQPSSNKLFVSHGTQVNVVDKRTGDSLGAIKNLDGVHGIAFVPGLNKGYISNGRGNNIVVFDLADYKILTTISGGGNPDAIFYEAALNRIVVCNGKSRDISLIDPTIDKVITTIAVDGRPEVAVSNGKNLFVNLEDKGEIAVISLADFSIKQRWPLKPDEAPTGMAMDVKNNLLFTACSETSRLLIIDAATGKIKQRLPIGEDCDGVGFDKSKGLIYASNKGGTLTVIKQKNATAYTVEAAVATQYGAKTIAVDEETHKIYLPTATLQKGGDEEKPKIIPATFTVLVFGQ